MRVAVLVALLADDRPCQWLDTVQVVVYLLTRERRLRVREEHVLGVELEVRRHHGWAHNVTAQPTFALRDWSELVPRIVVLFLK